MAVKKSRKEFSTGKSIVILFLYLIVWWICLTLFSYSVNLDENSLTYYIVNFLRIAVPLMALVFGAPIILIVGYDKKKKKNKKISNSRN